MNTSCPYCGAAPDGRGSHCWQCGRFLDRPSHEPGLVALGVCLFLFLAWLAWMWHDSAIGAILLTIIAALRTFDHFCRGHDEDVWRNGLRAALCFFETFGMSFLASLMALIAFIWAFAIPLTLLALVAGEEQGFLVGCWIGLVVSLAVFGYIFRKLAPGRVFSAGPPFDPSCPNR